MAGQYLVVVLVCWVCCVVTMMTTLCVSVQRLREFNVYLCKKSLRKPKMIILFMDVYKSGFYWSSGFGICNFGGFVSFLAGTDIRRNSYMMDNFGRQNSDGQFCASDTHTDTLLIFIPPEVLFFSIPISSESYLLLCRAFFAYTIGSYQCT